MSAVRSSASPNSLTANFRRSPATPSTAVSTDFPVSESTANVPTHTKQSPPGEPDKAMTNILQALAPQPPKSSRKSTATGWETGLSVQPTTVPAAQPRGAQSSPPKKTSKVAKYFSWEFRKTSSPTAAKPPTPRVLRARNSV